VHPFANGNGRIARVWANWAAMRYGLPPFVRLTPRPEGMAYAIGAHASMPGDHTVAVAGFRQQLTEFLNSLPKRAPSRPSGAGPTRDSSATAHVVEAPHATWRRARRVRSQKGHYCGSPRRAAV
jgi:hypothetical protein